MVRALLLDAQAEGDVVAEARALVTLASVALREACDLPADQRTDVDKLLGKASRTAWQALQRLENASGAASDATQMQCGGTTLGAAAVLTSVNALVSAGRGNLCESARGDRSSADALVERLGALPHNPSPSCITTPPNTRARGIAHQRTEAQLFVAFKRTRAP